MKIEKKVLDMSLAGIFTAIILMMGFMNATIIHVPVIIGAIVLGPKYGAWLGLVFGLTSLVKATLTPTVTSFVFSPFITIGGYSGNMWSVVIAIVPRICIGIAAYYAYEMASRMLKGKKGGRTISLWIAGILLVMNGIYVFFGNSYAAASNQAVGHVYDLILWMIVAFGIPEAIIAGILSTAVIQALFRSMLVTGKK